MKDFNEGPTDDRYADFVFYVARGAAKAASSQEALVKLGKELAGVIEEAGIQDIDRMTRYNQPVVIGGKKVPGLTFSQGNGDFKDYLKRAHGEKVLGLFYDASQNYSVRPEE